MNSQTVKRIIKTTYSRKNNIVISAEITSHIYKKNYYGVRALTMLINFLYKTNLSDSAGATKIFRKSIYDKMEIKTNEFDFEFDVLCKFAKSEKKIADFPIDYFPRTFAEGKKLRAFKDGMLILRSILRNYLLK